MSRVVSPAEARRRGRVMQRVLMFGAAGMLGLQAVWAAVAAFVDDPVNIPAALWAVAALVGPVAVAVYWRPAYRVPNCLFQTGAATFALGLSGVGWGSVVAPVIAGLTIVGLIVIPKDGPGRQQWGPDEPEIWRL